MPKSETGWASVPAGKLEAAKSKLLVALGDHGAKVITWLDDDEEYRMRVAEFMVREAVILKQITSVSVSACKLFVAKDHFIVDTSASAKVRIGNLGDDFKKYFLGKTEENIPAATLTVHTLERDSLDADIRAELTPEREETTLSHLYELLSKQPEGEDGILLTNGNANIFYIRDTNGVLWAVDAYWDAHYGDWNVHAYSVEGPGRWYAGDRVFSR